MTTSTTLRSLLSRWTVAVPVVAFVALLLSWGRKGLPGFAVALVALCLAGAVLAAVHHAEVVAHRVGEPFGSLVLAVAVTLIEVALIVTLMIDGGARSHALARDTVFAAVMITTNGIVGLCLLIGALRRRVAVFSAEGASAALTTVGTLAALGLVLPTFTTSTPGPRFSGSQLTFAAITSLALYALFVTVQTVRHREYFLPVDDEGRPYEAGGGRNADDEADEEEAGHGGRPTRRAALLSLVVLLLALVAVVGDAKAVSPTIESGVESAGLPQAVVGVIIALLVLLPETLSALRAARRDHIQTSLNLAYGSAIASIGLTIPAIALATVFIKGPLVLGLNPTHMVLLALTLVVSALTVLPGRATLLQGGVHLVLCAAFIFLAVSP
ncbi:calcium:proton antiporter [Streptomyces sp. NBC_01497]|uniref:calcium:proton antiporter n=1 Tax=Streptomyces sp. NBC_01497 TaxID=2903885 RepID=UPI002E3071E8|nr:ionic transporter y4hA [Streptomyces sp. NBC_01497]